MKLFEAYNILEFWFNNKNAKILSQDQIFKKIVNILHAYFDVESNISITPQTNLENDLGFDQLDFVHFLKDMEIVFKLKIPESVIKNHPTTVSEYINLVINLSKTSK